MPFGNRYIDTLAMLRRGTLLEDAANDLTVLTAACEETGKSGTLTITIKIEPQKNDPSVLTITDKIVLKEPKPEVAATIAYINAQGEITRRDPRQPELPVGVDSINKDAASA